MIELDRLMKSQGAASKRPFMFVKTSFWKCQLTQIVGALFRPIAKYIHYNTERKPMAKENDYLGSFRLSQPEYEAAVALAKSREWSLSKLIRRSLQATIAAAKQGETERRPA